MNRTPEECLRVAVDALGGCKVVGSALWPAKVPALAGQRLSHCLDPDRDEKLSEYEQAFIWRAARLKARHEGFEEFALSIGYRVVAVVDELQEIADMAKQSADLAKRSSDLSAEVLARMKSAHLNIDA